MMEAVADALVHDRTNELAAFVSRTARAAIPQSVLTATADFVLDGSAALLAAANPEYSTGRIISDFVREQGGQPQASVVGQGFQTSVVNAALANGTMGYACDIEPHHPEAILHPIAVMVPTALAVAEYTSASGLNFLKAIAVGCEVEYRCSMALGPAEQYALGFHPSAVCGAFGATAAAGLLLDLDQPSMVRAFGLAACQASGMMAWESDPTENARPFQMGMAARNGVTAALLASRKFGGPSAVFDRGHTVFRAFSRRPNPEKLVSDLGKRWDGILELAIKPYSCVAFLHPALDAIFELAKTEKIVPSDIKAIRMRFPRAGVHCVDDNPLKSHCAQYILPVAIANGELKISDIFFDRRNESPAIARLGRKVTVIPDDELDRIFPDFYATIIEIDTNDGRQLSRRKDIARGYPEAPMSPTEIGEKFRRLVSEVGSGAYCDILLSVIRRLADSADVHEYARLMRDPR